MVLGDRLRLHQLFANLLANIRTHTPTGTVATVAVLAGLDEIAISVSDNGCVRKLRSPFSPFGKD